MSDVDGEKLNSDEPAAQAAQAEDPTPETPITEPTASEPVKEAPKKSGKARWWIAIGLTLIIVFAAAGGVYAYQQNQTRTAAADQVSEATTLIEDADVVVLQVDEAVRAEITTEVGEQAAELTEQVPTAIEDLGEAIALIDDAIPDLADDEVAHAEALKASAEARAEMLAAAEPILEANIKAAAALQPSLDGWAAVLEGETLADSAIAEYNKLTTDGVTRSQTLTADALAKFTASKELFSQAATGFPEADFSAYVAYVDGKIALLGISKQANEAFLAGNKAKANELSNQYNAKDKELVAQAAKLPATPAEVVASAYEEVAGPATTEYFEARERATQADKVLNDLEG